MGSHCLYYTKACVKQPLSKDQKLVFKINYRLMQVKSIAECSKWSILQYLTFIKLPFVIKIFVLCIFEWLFYTCFTVYELRISYQSSDTILFWIHCMNEQCDPDQLASSEDSWSGASQFSKEGYICLKIIQNL